MKTKLSVLLATLILSTAAVADMRPGDHHEQGQGTITAHSFRGIVNLSVDGDAARLLYKGMTNAHEETRRHGSLFITRRASPNLACTFVAEVRATYHCTLHMTEAGDLNADNVMFTE